MQNYRKYMLKRIKRDTNVNFQIDINHNSYLQIFKICMNVI